MLLEIQDKIPLLLLNSKEGKSPPPHSRNTFIALKTAFINKHTWEGCHKGLPTVNFEHKDMKQCMGHMKMGGPSGKAGEGRGQGQGEREADELQASSSSQGPPLRPQPTSLALVVSKFQSEGGAPMKAGAWGSRHRTETKGALKGTPPLSVQVHHAFPSPGGICFFTSPLVGLGNLESRGTMFEQGGGAPGFNGLPWSIHAQPAAQEKGQSWPGLTGPCFKLYPLFL